MRLEPEEKKSVKCHYQHRDKFVLTDANEHDVSRAVLVSKPLKQNIVHLLGVNAELGSRIVSAMSPQRLPSSKLFSTKILK